MNYYDIGTIQSDKNMRINELQYKLDTATKLERDMFAKEWKAAIKQLKAELKELDEFHKQLFRWTSELEEIKKA